MTTQTAAALGQVTVRLFDDGGVEVEFGVDHAHVVELLNVASARLASIRDRVVDEERVPVACSVCGDVVTGIRADVAGARFSPCGHAADSY